jgi:aminoglycoside/choline kinase family phosphotransferase
MKKENILKTEKLLVDSLFSNSIRNKKIEHIESFQATKLTGDASSRRYYRILGEGARSYVVCLDQSCVDKNLEDILFTTTQKILGSEGVRVPKIYDKQLNKGYILEEDLGDQTLLKKLSTLESQKDELVYYEKALTELMKIHSINPDSYPEQEFSKLAFDEEKLFSEVEFTQKNLINGLFNTELGASQQACLDKSFRQICHEIAEQKRVPTHRDFHSRNIMIKDQELIVIDFQDMRMGIPQYDLVSLLEDCYYKISRQNKHTLKRLYWTEFLEKRFIQNSFEEFSVLYDKMAIQRTFKALGSFAYIFRMRGDVRYLKYIGYAFEKLRDILFRYEQYNDLRMVLAEVYYDY